VTRIVGITLVRDCGVACDAASRPCRLSRHGRLRRYPGAFEREADA